MLCALKTYNKDILSIILNFLNFILSTNTTELFKQGESNVILTLLNYFQSLSQHLLQRNIFMQHKFNIFVYLLLIVAIIENHLL